MNQERSRFAASFDGLDATGKTTLVEMLKSKLGAVVLQTPPAWLRPYRESFNRQRVELRFLYYALGNMWVDRYLLRPILAQNDHKLVIQDRSWLSTLSAHELRGVSARWLDLGVKLAKVSVSPELSLILHVDANERYQRLVNRGLVTETDMQNLQYEGQMEGRYFKWADRLGWNTQRFDNTNFTPEEACQALVGYIQN